jgi:DNA-binding transcriptional LysR family regulator
LELYQLRSFATVAELGHLTRAADRLHVSQPALSAQIKALEDELGVPLFDRGPTGMTLTPAGKRLLPDALKVIADAEALRGAAASIKGAVAGPARVGTLSDPDFIRLPDFLSASIERFPLIEIELHHEVTGAAFAEVRDGRLDMSFYYGDLAHPTVAAVPLAEVAYVVAGPAAWRERIEGADWETIAGLPWIAAPAISTHRVLAESLFDARGLAPTQLIGADNEAVIRSLVHGGLGMALMREDVAAAGVAAGELAVWSDARLATTLQFIYLQAREDEPVVNALRSVIEGLWGLPAQLASAHQAMPSSDQA